MNIKEKKDKVVAHVKDHKGTYIAIGVTAVLSVGGTLSVTNRGPKAVQLSPLSFAYKSTLVQTAALTRRGHPGIVIRDELTGEISASIRRAAQTAGISRSELHNQIGGRFTDLGEAK